MKRSAIENISRNIPGEFKKITAKDPAITAIVSFAAGIFVCLFPSLVFSLLFLAIIAGGVLWFLGEDDDGEVDISAGKTSRKNVQNGSGKGQEENRV